MNPRLGQVKKRIEWTKRPLPPGILVRHPGGMWAKCEGEHKKRIQEYSVSEITSNLMSPFQQHCQT